MLDRDAEVWEFDRMQERDHPDDDHGGRRTPP
jgi:hypothetical protein